MENLYQQSKLISKEEFARIERVFQSAWGKDTVNPDALQEWSEENKALGQCAITALVVYDLYGGKMAYNRENYHIWNELPDGTQQDFSRCQFKDDRVFTITKYKTKEEILHDENGQRTNIIPRYELLKKRFEDALRI